MKELIKKHIFEWSDKLNKLRTGQVKDIPVCEEKVAILGDIHSNLEALKEVLADAKGQGIVKFVCTGDIVGYAANPEECLAIIRDLKCPCVMGNHDQYVGTNCNVSDFNLYAMNAVLWTRENLSTEEREWLTKLPMVLENDNDVLSNYLGFNDFEVVHSSLSEPEKWLYILKEDSFQKALIEQKNDLVFFGHTHVPSMFGYNEETKEFRSEIPLKQGVYKLEKGWKWLVNPGSVGQPRDRNVRASYAIYDSAKKEIEIRRVVYDIAKASKKVEKAGLPLKNGKRLYQGK